MKLAVFLLIVAAILLFSPNVRSEQTNKVAGYIGENPVYRFENSEIICYGTSVSVQCKFKEGTKK